MRVNDGGPAFPVPSDAIPNPNGGGFINMGDYGMGPQSGMSLRDWFAGLAMQALLGRGYVGDDSQGDPGVYAEEISVSDDDSCSIGLDILGADAYRAADAMLAAREIEPEVAIPALGGSVTVEPITKETDQ